jgi:murein L,D-transpeptidase YafK
LVASSKADFVLVDKSERSLFLLKNGKVIGSYRVALGRNPLGPKVQEGDKRTPEGQYRIDSRNAASGFYRALHISYPNAADRERANQAGVAPGGDIMIHGMKNGFGWIGRLHRLVDWTNGCIAVTDQEMREIWSAVPNSTPIEIRP